MNSFQFYILFYFRSGASAEFHFKSDWNNKAPPPGLVLFGTSTDNNGLHHQTGDDTKKSHNNHDLHNPPGADPSLETVQPETFSDVSAFRNPKFNANQFFLSKTTTTSTTSSVEIQDSERKNPNLDLSLMVSHHRKR